VLAWVWAKEWAWARASETASGLEMESEWVKELAWA
jgi:hypothetical protein